MKIIDSKLPFFEGLCYEPQDATLKTEIGRLSRLHCHCMPMNSSQPLLSQISPAFPEFKMPFFTLSAISTHFREKKISFTGVYTKIDSEKTSALFLDFRPFAMLKVIARAETPANSSSSLVSRSESAPGGIFFADGIDEALQDS